LARRLQAGDAESRMKVDFMELDRIFIDLAPFLAEIAGFQ